MINIKLIFYIYKTKILEIKHTARIRRFGKCMLQGLLQGVTAYMKII